MTNAHVITWTAAAESSDEGNSGEVARSEDGLKASDAVMERRSSRPGATPLVDVAAMELSELAELARGGEREAFGALVRRLQEPLYYAVLRVVRHSADARDIVQRTFVKAWSSRESLKSPSAVRSWIFSIGLNLARNHLRDRGGRRFEQVEEHTATVAASAQTGLLERERKVILRELIAELPPTQRQVISLRIDSDLSFAEVAEIVGCSAGSARVNFHHGLKRLRERMQERLPDTSSAEEGER